MTALEPFRLGGSDPQGPTVRDQSDSGTAARANHGRQLVARRSQGGDLAQGVEDELSERLGVERNGSAGPSRTPPPPSPSANIPQEAFCSSARRKWRSSTSVMVSGGGSSFSICRESLHEVAAPWSIK